LEYLDGIVYRALQTLGCATASTAERETANYQSRVCKRQPTTAMRRHSLHVRRASHEEGSGMGASYMQLLPLFAPAPNPSRLPACSFKAHQGAPYKDPAEASRAGTHRSVLFHQSEWVRSKQTRGGPPGHPEATVPCKAPRWRACHDNE